MTVLFLVGLGWMYVVLMMTAAEAMAPNGTRLGALMTFLLYGVAPMSLALYLLGTPARRRRRRQQEAQAEQAEKEAAARSAPPSSADPDGRRHAAGDPVPTVREEP